MKLACPFCTESIPYDENKAGTAIECPWCHRSLKMPSLAELPPERQREYLEERHREAARAKRKAERMHRRASALRSIRQTAQKAIGLAKKAEWARRELAEQAERQREAAEAERERRRCELERQPIVWPIVPGREAGPGGLLLLRRLAFLILATLLVIGSAAVIATGFVGWQEYARETRAQLDREIELERLSREADKALREALNDLEEAERRRGIRLDSGRPSESSQFDRRLSATPAARPFRESGGLAGNARPVTGQSPEARCRAIAQHEYPNDSKMQQFVYDQQIAAYRYMASVRDDDAKQIALWEYPNDFAMQQYVYDRQLSAKKYMATVADPEVKRIALREYPNDFAMQKYVYDQQLSAKQYMAAVPTGSAKRKAMREYPYDYTMQKFTYDRLR